MENIQNLDWRDTGGSQELGIELRYPKEKTVTKLKV